MKPFKLTRLSYIDELAKDFVPAPEVYIFKKDYNVNDMWAAMEQLYDQTVTFQIFHNSGKGLMVDPRKFKNATYPPRPTAILLMKENGVPLHTYNLDPNMSDSGSECTLIIDVTNKLITFTSEVI